MFTNPHRALCQPLLAALQARPPRAQAAFRAVAQEMYGELCPFDRFNDVTLAHCFSTLGILKVNDDGCHAKSLTEDEPTIAEQVFNQASALHHSSIAEVVLKGVF